MADNYLEKRMEDLQSGRLGNSGKSTRVAVRPTRGGYLNIPFPERRVLITEGTHGLGRAIALAFRKADCRTAVFDTDKKEGETLAHDEGCVSTPPMSTTVTLSANLWITCWLPGAIST